jgi:uncharacterized protein (TIGR03435 family)
MRTTSKSLLVLTMLATLSVGGLLHAQDITGIWQGTMSVQGRDLRLQIRVTNDAGSLKASASSPDQGPGQLPGTVTLQSGTVKIVVPGINGTYEGKLSTDAGSLDGTWTQGQPLKLLLKKVTPEAAWTSTAPARLAPMAANWKMVFEVATIKPSQPDSPGQYITIRGRNLVVGNQTVGNLMTFAFGLHPDQIIGGPVWLKQDRFDIVAEPDGTGMPNDKQLRAALAKLLADRFSLTFHRDKKELTVYALTALKTGSKMTKNDSNPNGLPGLFFRGPGVMGVTNATMGDFTGVMQAVVLDRPMVDQTKLEGRYDFSLTWTPDETQFNGRGGQAPPPADPANAPPALSTAVQEQLGLKIDSTKTPVEVLVIDKVEKPSAN